MNPNQKGARGPSSPVELDGQIYRMGQPSAAATSASGVIVQWLAKRRTIDTPPDAGMMVRDITPEEWETMFARSAAAGQFAFGGEFWRAALSGPDAFSVLVGSLFAEHHPSLGPDELYSLPLRLLEENAQGFVAALLVTTATVALRAAFSATPPGNHHHRGTNA